MVAQAIKTGPQMQKILHIHNIPAANVTRHRDETFTVEFFSRQAIGEAISSKHAVEAPTNYANQIINALGGVRIVDTHETIATWTPEKVRIDATVKIKLVESVPEFTGFLYMGNFGEMCQPVMKKVEPSVKIAEYQVSIHFGHIAVFPCGIPQPYK